MGFLNLGVLILKFFHNLDKAVKVLYPCSAEELFSSKRLTNRVDSELLENDFNGAPKTQLLSDFLHIQS